MTSEATARAQIVEAVAWWRIGLSDGRAILARSATDALVAGLDGDALAELAGIRDDINPFELDALLDRLKEELGLRDALASDPEVVAVRRMCRVLLADDMSERELSRWVHTRFHHARVKSKARRAQRRRRPTAEDSTQSGGAGAVEPRRDASVPHARPGRRRATVEVPSQSRHIHQNA